MLTGGGGGAIRTFVYWNEILAMGRSSDSMAFSAVTNEFLPCSHDSLIDGSSGSKKMQLFHVPVLDLWIQPQKFDPFPVEKEGI